MNVRRASVVLCLAWLVVAILPSCTDESREEIRDRVDSFSPSRSIGVEIPTGPTGPSLSPRPTRTEEPTEEPEPEPTEEPEPEPTEERAEGTTSEPAADEDAPAAWLLVLLLVLVVGGVGAMIVGAGRRRRKLADAQERARRAAGACARTRDLLAALADGPSPPPAALVAEAVRWTDDTMNLARSVALSPPDDGARLAAERAVMALEGAAGAIVRLGVPEPEPGHEAVDPRALLHVAVQELSSVITELERAGMPGEA